MSNPESQTTKPKTAPPPPVVIETPRPDYGKTIQVRALKFNDAHPDFEARRTLMTETAENKGRVTIEFIPSIRHHRVEQFRPGKEPRVTMIHESIVAGWEPA